MNFSNAPELAGELLAPAALAAKRGLRILDADGWNDKDLNEPVTKTEFDDRLILCTIERRNPVTAQFSEPDTQ